MCCYVLQVAGYTHGSLHCIRRRETSTWNGRVLVLPARRGVVALKCKEWVFGAFEVQQGQAPASERKGTVRWHALTDVSGSQND